MKSFHDWGHGPYTLNPNHRVFELILVLLNNSRSLSKFYPILPVSERHKTKILDVQRSNDRLAVTEMSYGVIELFCNLVQPIS